MGSAGIPVLDLAASYEQLGRFLTERIAPDATAYGLELLQLMVENISLPTEVEQALDRRTSMGIVGDLNRYSQFQAAEAMRAAASNPGAAGSAIGMVVGTGLGQQVGPWGVHPATQPAQAPPPLPGSGRRYHVAVAGNPAGPFPVEELCARAQAGQLERSTLVWSEGMAAVAGRGRGRGAEAAVRCRPATAARCRLGRRGRPAPGERHGSRRHARASRARPAVPFSATRPARPS